MAYTGLRLYAGATQATMAELPSPTDISPTEEIIWSEDTGRAQSGTDKAKMIGSVVAEKHTYGIKWGILPATNSAEPKESYKRITDKLTAGFFYFCIATTPPTENNNYHNAQKYYRGEIQSDLLLVGGDLYYKDVAVSVIQQ